MIKLKVKKMVLVESLERAIKSIYKHSMLNINVYSTYTESIISEIIDFGKTAIKVLENIKDSLLHSNTYDATNNIIVNYYCKVEIPTMINNYQIYLDTTYNKETIHDSTIIDKLLDISLLCKNTLEDVLI